MIKEWSKRKTNEGWNYGRWLYQAFLSMVLIGSITIQAYAAETVFEKAKAVMKDVYTQIVSLPLLLFAQVL